MPQLKTKNPKIPFHALHQPIDFRDTWRIFKIMSEFVEGYHFLSGLKGDITFFGSARVKPNSKFYKLAQNLAYKLGKEKHAIITGGGAGIMEAANKGAYLAGAESAGLNIELPHEQVLNSYVKKSVGFHYFFTRKVMLNTPSQAFVFSPGGFGTLDEFFEIMDQMELGIMEKVPVIALVSEFWQPIFKFLKKYSCETIGALAPESLSLFQIVDSPDEAARIIRPTKEKKFFSPLSPHQFVSGESLNWRIFRIMAELVQGFDFANKIKNGITILGTKSIKPGAPYYKEAYKLAKLLGQKGYAIVTGGGPGISEAANKGASEAGAGSISMSMSFDHAIINPYVKESLAFIFPFTRTLVITAPSKAFIMFPGGYGTLHQTFEVLTLMQTRKMGKIPVILFGKEFWQPLQDFFKKIIYSKNKFIEKEDLDFFTIVDSAEEAYKTLCQKL